MVAISSFKSLQVVREDLDDLQPDEKERIKKALNGIKNRCVLGPRDPRLHHEYERLGEWGEFQLYRKWLGRSKFRLIFAVEGERILLVAVVEKDDDTYDLPEYSRRLKRNCEWL